MRLGVGAYMAVVVVATACGVDTSPVDLGPRPAPREASRVVTQSPINPRLLRRFRALQPVPAPVGTDVDRVALGRALFFETRLSEDGTSSCNTCHQFDHGGAEPRPTSRSTGKHPRNAPSVFNAAGHVAQFWDGRSPSLEAQAVQPLLDVNELGMRSPDEVVRVLAAIPAYPPMFAAAYGETGITFDHVTDAIGAFERTLRTPSRWDRFLSGDRTALSGQEIDGLKMFADTGCVGCHTGELVGGSMFQRAGVVRPWPDQRDLGRFEVTGRDEDRMIFKVPSLRNVALTAPYFHDGTVADLHGAVRMMARYQLGVELTSEEVAQIVAFLGALSGDPLAL